MYNSWLFSALEMFCPCVIPLLGYSEEKMTKCQYGSMNEDEKIEFVDKKRVTVLSQYENAVCSLELNTRAQNECGNRNTNHSTDREIDCEKKDDNPSPLTKNTNTTPPKITGDMTLLQALAIYNYDQSSSSEDSSEGSIPGTHN